MTPEAYKRPLRTQAWGLALRIGVVLWVLCTRVAAQELTPWTDGQTPPLALTDQQGTSHALTAYHGRVVLVNFWATWCEPCREEMPALQQLQNTLGKERLVVLAVNYGESSGKVQEFAGQVPVNFPLLLDRHIDVAKAWQVRVLPTSFVLGPDGRIRYYAIGPLDWGDTHIVNPAIVNLSCQGFTVSRLPKVTDLVKVVILIEMRR
jgi:thiol-disulfide isomerase/thioredoxin